jgi:hypothetical protein
MSDEPSIAGKLRVDLVPDEILLSTSAIVVEALPGTEAELVNRALSVADVAGSVEETENNTRFAWKPAEPMRAGAYRLLLAQPPTPEIDPAPAPRAIPFRVVETRAAIPEHARVLSLVRLSLERDGFKRLDPQSSPEGRFIELIKGIDRRTGASLTLGFDEQGAPIDALELVRQHERRLEQEQGKLHPALVRMLEQLPPDEVIRIDAWFHLPDDLESLAKARLRFEPIDVNLVEDRRALIRERAGSIVQLLSSLPLSIRETTVDELAPVITLDLPASEVRALAQREELVRFYLREQRGIEDLVHSMAIARSDVVHQGGQTGTGVRVAVWEDGPASLANLNVIKRFSVAPILSSHAQSVHATIQNHHQGSAPGHAPGCELYSANSMSRAALTWAVQEGCSVINQSFHMPAETASAVPSGDDAYADWLAANAPFPLIVQASGNFGQGDPDGVQPPEAEYVNHKGYNTICVGNHDDSGTVMDPFSVFRNPETPFRDRELPEIAANGCELTLEGIIAHGTSLSAPAVAGVAALIQATASLLKHWPEGCRAILFASARRTLSSNTWWQDICAGVDARAGAGALDADEARQVAGEMSTPDGPAQERGWDVSVLASEDFDTNAESTFVYRVAVPSSGGVIKVALAWCSKVAKTGHASTSVLTVDLDLIVYDSAGNQAGFSGSYDNSYEIAELVGEPGETYTIKVRRQSGTDPVRFGLAWNVRSTP